MENLAHSEMALPVRDFDQAAALLAHGFRLLKAPVGQWSYEFDSLDDYLRWKQGDSRVVIHETVMWNIACMPGPPLVRAYEIIGRANEMKHWSQVQKERAFLIEIYRQRPRNALWVVVHDGPKPGMAFSMFGHNASLRVQEQMLNAL